TPSNSGEALAASGKSPGRPGQERPPGLPQSATRLSEMPRRRGDRTRRGIEMSIALDPRVEAFVQARHGLLIDGEVRPALSAAEMPLFNPATGEELARVALAGKADVDQAVAAARRAFEGSWAAQRPADRERLLLKLADLLE